MAMRILVHNEPQNAYLGGLQAFIVSVSPLLLKRDRWGYHTLEKCFGIDGASALYTPPKFKGSVANSGQG